MGIVYSDFLVVAIVGGAGGVGDLHLFSFYKHKWSEQKNAQKLGQIFIYRTVQAWNHSYSKMFGTTYGIISARAQVLHHASYIILYYVQI